MIELRKSYLTVISASLINIGSGLFLIPFAVTDISFRVISFILALVFLRTSVFVEDTKEDIYG